MKLILELRKTLVILFLFIHLQACLYEPVPEFSDIKSTVLKNIETYEILAKKSRSVGITRVSIVSSNSSVEGKVNVYPKGQLSSHDEGWFLQQFIKLGIEIGVQVYKEESIVEFLYWSTGLVDRGQLVRIVFSELELSSSVFYGKEMAEGSMECKKIKRYWFACFS